MAKSKKKRQKIKQDVFANAVIVTILVILSFLAIYPLWFVLVASFSDPGAVGRGEVFFWPKGMNFSAYKKILDYPEILIGYRNSLIYMFAGSFITLCVTLPAAYALSRQRLKGRRVLNFMFVISMYFSGGLIPTYLLHRSLGWLDTVWVLLIPSALSAYYLILARSNFESLPEAMHEAAVIDGADDFRFFFQFALPLSKAMIAVIFLFSALAWWNEYMRFIIYTSNQNIQGLQVFVRQIQMSLTTTLSDQSVDALIENQQAAELLKYSVVVITALPFCLLYPFVQKYFNQGVMIGAIKE